MQQYHIITHVQHIFNTYTLTCDRLTFTAVIQTINLQLKQCVVDGTDNSTQYSSSSQINTQHLLKKSVYDISRTSFHMKIYFNFCTYLSFLHNSPFKRQQLFLRTLTKSHTT